jgi:FtsZ-interacting cell division protein ZipA
MLAAELRWILLALSVPVLAAIWWWTARRSRHTPGNSSREYTPPPPEVSSQPIVRRAAESYIDEEEPRAWGVPPFEPLSIRTTDFDPPEIPDVPMSATFEPVDMSFDAPMEVPPLDEPSAAPLSPASLPPSEAADVPPAASPTPTAPPATPETANTSEAQQIVGLRVCAKGESRWPGSLLVSALERHGLAYGRYKIFHYRHTDGRTLFCGASLVDPGTFDVATMLEEEFGGLALFAVLPGPADPRRTVETLIATAENLADTLQGTVEDSQGAPLSPQRADALREDVARFHASLTMS